MDLISVIVPVYKVEQYLERCVRSILNQTYKNFELILVNDGSPDKCPEMCEQYAKEDSRVCVLHQENGGLSAARNTGIDWMFENSTSQWVTYIDSDDWVHPRYLEVLLEAAKSTQHDISMCPPLFTNIYQMLEIKDEDVIPQLWEVEELYKTTLLAPNTAWAKMYKRELFRNVRYPEGKLFEDRFTTYKVIFQYKKIALVNVPLYYYYTNPEGIVQSKWTLKKLDDLQAMEEQLAYFKYHEFHGAYLHTLEEYVHSLVYSLRQMKGKKDLKKEAIVVRRKLKKVLSKYKKMLGVSFDKDFNTYKYAYPLVAKVYRRIKNI